MSPEQTRAARAWLNLSQEEFAHRANVSVSTLKDFERGRRVPIKNNLDIMRHAFEAAGIQMLFDGQGKSVGIKISDADGTS